MQNRMRLPEADSPTHKADFGSLKRYILPVLDLDLADG
jgi:hypothetical protein